MLSPTDTFGPAPVLPQGIDCEFCGMVDCTMPGHTGEVLTNVVQEPSVMVHPGIPLGMAIPGVVAVIVATHLLLALFKNRHGTSSWRLDLLKPKPVEWLVQRRWFPMLLQAIPIGLFVLVIATGLFGSQRVFPISNIAPVLTWTIWWALLIFMVVAGGSAFCAICPWEGLASILSSLSLRSRIKRVGANLKWPKALANVYLAMGMFILLTWLELGLELTKSPMLTAVVAVGFVALTLIVVLFFERRTFCHYVCLVGRVQGLYALFAPVEVRARNFDVCRTCEGKECYTGSEKDVGCPTHLFPGALAENTYCTMCTECVRSCPEDNMTVQLRPPAADLDGKKRFRIDEAIFAVVLLALTSFHGLTMTPNWIEFTNWIRATSGMGKELVFTIAMTVMMLWPLLLFYLAAKLARTMARESGVTAGKIFKAFAYSVLPIALFDHLAHNGMHFFMEAQHILPVLSDPFGWGWNLFGTADKVYPPMLTLRTIWWFQLILIVIGHLYSVVVSDRIARAVFSERRAAVRALTPLLIAMVLYSCFSIWLIAQPMEMRSGM